MRVIADVHAGNPKPACDRPLERFRLPPRDGGSIDKHTSRQPMQVTERIVGPRGLRRAMAHEDDRTSQCFRFAIDSPAGVDDTPPTRASRDGRLFLSPEF